MAFSDDADLYDKIVPKDNLLRQIHDLVGFSFVHEDLAEKFSLDWGRGAIAPAWMFKVLLFKVLFDASDVDVVERSRCVMSFKHFLGMNSEDSVINHGYDMTSSSGLCGMQMQGAMTIFAVILKRILTLIGAKHKE